MFLPSVMFTKGFFFFTSCLALSSLRQASFAVTGAPLVGVLSSGWLSPPSHLSSVAFSALPGRVRINEGALSFESGHMIALRWLLTRCFKLDRAVALRTLNTSQAQIMIAC